MSEPKLRVLSLGAGLQSSCLALMFERGEFDYAPDVAIFADTMSETADCYRWLDYLDTQVTKFPILRVSAGSLEQNMLDGVRNGTRVAHAPFYTGDAGPLRRICTREFKVDVILRTIRELLGAAKGSRVAPESVEQYFGITVDEVQRMRDSHVRWIRNAYPLIDRRMDRNDCAIWLKKNGYPEPKKSACYFCPYRSDASWRRLRDEQPEEFQRAIWFDAQIRTGLPGVRNECFVHRKQIPLGEVDLSTLEDLGQGSLFDEAFGGECEGMCGV